MKVLKGLPDKEFLELLIYIHDFFILFILGLGLVSLLLGFSTLNKYSYTPNELWHEKTKSYEDMEFITVAAFMIYIIVITIKNVSSVSIIASRYYMNGLDIKKKLSSAITHDFKSMIGTAFDTIYKVDDIETLKELLIFQIGDLQVGINEFSEFNKIDRPDAEELIKSRMQDINIGDYLADYIFRQEQIGGLPDSIKIKDNLLEDDIYIRACSDSLASIFGNLISNTKKYAEASEIYFRTAVENNKYIHIYYGDNGMGISEDIKSHIFDPFVYGDSLRSTIRTQSNNKNAHYKSGLGMHIVKKHVEMNKGTIQLLDAEQGTMYDVCFPIAKKRK